MTPLMAIKTARQMYMMMYGLEVDEQMFVDMVAPEIYGAAKMENKAAREIVKNWCDGWNCNKLGPVQELASRYEVPSQSNQPTEAQPEPQQTEETRVVLATEAEQEALLGK